MNNFEYFTPTKVFFGKNEEKNIATIIKKYNYHKVLLHYGGQSALKSGLIQRVKDQLVLNNIEFVEVGGVVPNPRLSKVRFGMDIGKKENIDFILAVGGGSVIDSAKAIAYGLADQDNDVWELFEHKRRATACLPIGAILTIAAAGSEMSNSCVITNDETDEKRAYDDDLSRLKFAILDPSLTIGLPAWQTASGCVDILMHTMERYFTGHGKMEITDSIAEGLMRTVIKHAEILYTNPDNYESRAEIMWASSLSHNGLTGCGSDGGDWACHLLEHELGGMFDVTHGAGLAAIWPSWAKYVDKDNLSCFTRFAVEVMGVKLSSQEETALRGIAAIEAFFHEIGMPINLKELGIVPTEDQIIQMSESCWRASGESLGSAKALSLEDIKSIYKNSLGDD